MKTASVENWLAVGSGSMVDACGHGGCVHHCSTGLGGICTPRLGGSAPVAAGTDIASKYGHGAPSGDCAKGLRSCTAACWIGLADGCATA